MDGAAFLRSLTERPSANGRKIEVDPVDKFRLAWTARLVEPVPHLALSSNGRELAAGRSDGFVAVLETSTGALAKVIPAHFGAGLTGMAFAKGSLLATIGKDCSTTVWDVKKAECVCNRAVPAVDPPGTERRDEAHSLAMRPDGRVLSLARGRTI